MDLPVPGAPTMSTLWPPAAAISKARLAACWPLTSRMSAVAELRTCGGDLISSQGVEPVVAVSLAVGGEATGAKRATTSSKCATRTTLASGTRQASSALPSGNTRMGI